MKSDYRGRIAPTPSGLLHMGHARTFKTAWERARERGGKIILRIEDIDLERCRKEYSDASLRDLKAIGLDWDEGPDAGGEFAPYTQSERMGYYWKCMKRLIEKRLAYPCSASRAQIKKESKKFAPKIDGCEREAIFPECLRNDKWNISDIKKPEEINWRFRVPDGMAVEFTDNNFGPQSFTAGKDFGDFLVWRKTGTPSYELAVVADDAAMRITEVVRGRDLLVSTARQILLYGALGFEIPEFFHCELLRDESGEKISKSSIGNSETNAWLICNRAKCL